MSIPSSIGVDSTAPAPRARRAMILVDLAITLAIIGIVLLAVIPTMRPEEHVKLIAASTILASDIEFAQSSTLTDPGDPTVVRFDTGADRYWLALKSAPETPITRPNSEEPYEVVFGQGDADDLWGMSISLANLPDQTIEFDAFGRTTGADDALITLTSEAGGVVVRVRADTGSVWIERPGS